MASIKLKSKASGGVIKIKALVKHPMETGLRKSKGKTIPANYITNLVIRHNGKVVVESDIGSAVSKDPYFSFYIPGQKGDEVTLSYQDNKGKSGSETVVSK